MTQNRIYAVANAHLDTVWKWELPKTIEEFIPATIDENLKLIQKYPDYKFNFEGAFRYELIEEYYPEVFEELKGYINEGRWCVAGTAYENGDINIPSPEAIIRNYLYGYQYIKSKFGKTPNDMFLPDCFGFGYALPTIAKHLNLKGISTQKLRYGGAYERPFDIGILRGVDGSQILSSLNPLSYHHEFSGDIRADVETIGKLADNGINNSLAWTMDYYGTGDNGGAPSEESVKSVCESVNSNDENTIVKSASSDEIFNDIKELAKAEKISLPLWDNELQLKSHGTGCYTSRSMSKRLNAQCENLADLCEKACVFADLLTSYKYPKHNIDSAWKKVIQHQFHDDITGTSTMAQYNDSWNDYFVSQSQFITEYEGAVGAIANELDTSWCKECAVIVNNPVASDRTACVEAKIKLKHNTKHIKIVDKNGNEAPSQIIAKNGKELCIVFLADVKSVGYKVYDVQVCEKPCEIKSDLIVTEHSLENSKCVLRFNKNGDIASIVDKELKVQILSKPIKLEALSNIGEMDYPSWIIRQEELDKEPYAYANTPEFEIIENGPARIAVKVTRHIEKSSIEQVVSLEANAKIIRVDNFIDWQERRTLLKASFPFNASNEIASFDLGLGYISRATSNDNLYEFSAQKWADITDEYGQYGVSVLTDCKYGWDKPNDNTLRLSCIHTPAGAFSKEARQDLQDIGRNIFSFGIYSHSGKIDATQQIEAEYFNKKMIAFQTSSRRDGSLNDSVSMLNINNENVIVRALKKSEDNKSIIVRVNEGVGNTQQNVELSLYGGVKDATEVYANEEYLADAKIKNDRIIFDLKPFEIKTFMITLGCQKNKAQENFKKINLEYNASGITNDEYKVHTILQGSGRSLPSELIPQSHTVKGITFKMPSIKMDKNILIPREQVIDIPKGSTKIYMLASSTLGEQEITFFADNKERHLTIYPMAEKYGIWDMAGLEQTAKINNAEIGFEFTHTHHPEGNIANGKAYFYLYEIDVRNCKILTLPYENRVVILAMTAVKKFSNTNLTTDLIDRIDEEYTFADTQPINKIIDKADFVTINAGKIQNQIKKNGRKGLISNIIKSYTNSEK